MWLLLSAHDSLMMMVVKVWSMDCTYIYWIFSFSIFIGEDEKVVSGKSCVSPSGAPLWVRTNKNYTSCNYYTKQLHCMTTPNQTIPLYDNTPQGGPLWAKPNNSIVWQHQTEKFHCLTTCKNMILWQEDTAKNNVSSSPPGPFRAWEESCVGERVMKKSCHSRTTKIIKSCNY